MRKIQFDEETISKIREFAKDHTLLESCNRFTLSPNVMKRVANHHGIRFIISDKQMPCENHVKLRFETNHPVYGNILCDGKGRLMCAKPEWYTGRVGSQYVFVNSVVMCESLGITEIPKGFIVFPIDGNDWNYGISNLALTSLSGYNRLHQIEDCKVRRSEKIRKEETPETPDNG